MPTFTSILEAPDTIAISDEPSVKHAIVGVLLNNVNETNIGKIAPFIERLPVEFQIILLEPLVKKHPRIAVTPTFNKLMLSIGTKFL